MYRAQVYASVFHVLTLSFTSKFDKKFNHAYDRGYRVGTYSRVWKSGPSFSRVFILKVWMSTTRRFSYHHIATTLDSWNFRFTQKYHGSSCRANCGLQALIPKLDQNRREGEEGSMATFGTYTLSMCISSKRISALAFIYYEQRILLYITEIRHKSALPTTFLPITNGENAL